MFQRATETLGIAASAMPLSLAVLAQSANRPDATAPQTATGQYITPTALRGAVQQLLNPIEVGVRGQKPSVQLVVVNHPITGPVMSGPHQTPFKCETQAFGFGPPLDTDCTVTTHVEYFY